MKLAGITGGGNFQRSKKFLSAYRPHKLKNTRGTRSFTSFMRVGDVTCASEQSAQQFLKHVSALH